jgi:hypothetical protein
LPESKITNRRFRIGYAEKEILVVFRAVHTIICAIQPALVLLGYLEIDEVRRLKEQVWIKR